MSDKNGALLSVDGLEKYFPVKHGVLIERTVDYVKAVDGVSFDLKEGETLGLVGESGSGKSTTGYCVLQLTKPTAGSVRFQGQELTTMSRGDLRKMRRDMQIVFQDPYASLNPRMTVGNIVSEPLEIHGIGTRRSRAENVRRLLEVVGFNPDFTNRYPHEFSGGQRQRIGIARTLALRPKLIVADEPVSALDVSIQAQVVNLLEDLQDEFDLTYVMIAHDLSVVRHVSDRVAVMYLGKIVEIADRVGLYEKPMHPYTLALLSAVPIPDTKRKNQRERIRLQGDVPSPINPPAACRFHTRCWKAQDICKTTEPPLLQLAPGHQVACHFPENQPS
jgi:peptide/nickel transport system ATP-binding protein